MTSLQRNWGSSVADAFVRAWESSSLAECPPMADWDGLLDSAAPQDLHIVVAPNVVAEPSLPRPETRLPLPAYAAFPSEATSTHRADSGGWGWLWWIAMVGFIVLLLIFMVALGGRH